ncbi:unnamed protein product [Sphagnum jensenii]|uniref:Secreted protein n=1 Tax=Sphagnum jensenii TaxID=128206 RepID=A0ABP1AHM8_9BRYO
MPSHPDALPFGIAAMASWISFKVSSLVSSWFVLFETRVGVLAQHASRASEVPGALTFEVVMSKYVVVLGGADVRPQTIITSGEWSEIFFMDGAASIFPPLESSSWETWNLSIRETADP